MKSITSKRKKNPESKKSLPKKKGVRKNMKPVLLVPGASATGRDFLLELLSRESKVLAERVGKKSVQIAVAPKTTDRPARGAADATKICIPAEAFTDLLESGEVFAHYVLESNGHRYGYKEGAFDVDPKAEVTVSDASVYQIPALKVRLGERVHTAAMIATRPYREENLTSRGSESPEEVLDRLNLGDAHVALLIMMGGDPTVSYADFIDPAIAALIRGIVLATRDGKERKDLEAALKAICGSDTVIKMVKELATDHHRYVDSLVILGDRHRVEDGSIPMIETPFFEEGVKMIRAALGLN
jgi:ribose 1,5-bisphosphokinase PhnN